MSRDSIADVLIIIGILVMLVGGWQFAAADGAEAYHVSNETTTVETGSSYALSVDGVAYENVSVTANGTQYQTGEEFVLDEWAGSITWTDQAEDGANASIDYDAKQQDDTTKGLVSIMSPFRELWPFLLFLVVAGFVYATVDNTWGT